MKNPILLALITFLVLATASSVYVQWQKDVAKSNAESARSLLLEHWNKLYRGNDTAAYELMSDKYKSTVTESEFSKLTKQIHIPDYHLVLETEELNYDFEKNAKQAHAVVLATDKTTTTAFRLTEELIQIDKKIWRIDGLKIQRLYYNYPMGFMIDWPDGFVPKVNNYYTIQFGSTSTIPGTKRPAVRFYFVNFGLTKDGGVYDGLKDFVYKSQSSYRSDMPHYKVLSEGQYSFPASKAPGQLIDGWEHSTSFSYLNLPSKEWNIDLQYNDSIRSFVYSTSAELYDQYLPTIKSVVDSWRFLH